MIRFVAEHGRRGLHARTGSGRQSSPQTASAASRARPLATRRSRVLKGVRAVSGPPHLRH